MHPRLFKGDPYGRSIQNHVQCDQHEWKRHGGLFRGKRCEKKGNRQTQTPAQVRNDGADVEERIDDFGRKRHVVRDVRVDGVHAEEEDSDNSCQPAPGDDESELVRDE